MADSRKRLDRAHSRFWDVAGVVAMALGVLTVLAITTIVGAEGAEFAVIVTGVAVTTAVLLGAVPIFIWWRRRRRGR